LAVLCLLLHNSFAYLDPDMGWHLGLGKRIAETGSAPKTNLINYPIAGDAWVDHEWLLNWISFQVFDQFGYLALNLFFAGIIIAALAGLHFLINKYYLRTGSHLALAAFMLLGVHAMLPHLGIRMQEIAVLSLVILLILLYRYTYRNRAYLTLLWLPFLFWLWANLHGSFIIVIFLLFFWLGIQTALFLARHYTKLRLPVSDPVLPAKKLFAFAAATGLSIGATLLTPYGGAIIDLLDRIHVNDAYHLNNISEWLPTYALPLQYGQIIYMALAVTAVLIIVLNYFVFRKKHSQEQINLWFLALFALFLFLAFQSKRHFPLFFVVSLPLTVSVYSREFALPRAKLDWLKSSRFIAVYALAGLLLLGSYHLIKTNFTTTPFSNKQYCQTYPCQAVRFLKNDPELRDLRLLNNYDWGGYIFWTWPGKQTFIDGRLPQHPINGHTFLEEYHKFYQDKEEARAKLKEYGIELVLYKKYPPVKADWLETILFDLDDPVLERNNDQLKALLESSRNWELIYENNRSKVYKRKK